MLLSFCCQVGNLLMENAQLALQSDSMKSRAAAIQARSALFVVFLKALTLFSLNQYRIELSDKYVSHEMHLINMLYTLIQFMSQVIRYRGQN